MRLTSLTPAAITTVPFCPHSPALNTPPVFFQKLTDIVPSTVCAPGLRHLSGEDPLHWHEDSPIVIWGNHPRSFKTSRIESTLYWFTDTYKTKQRLNILGHGYVMPCGKGTISLIENQVHYQVDGSQLRQLYNYYYGKQSLRAYRYIRAISCFSADGTTPLGQQIANAFGLETKAFSGKTIAIHPENISIPRVGRKVFNNEISDWIAHRLIRECSFKYILKTKPIDQTLQRDWTGYIPVKFQPA